MVSLRTRTYGWMYCTYIARLNIHAYTDYGSELLFLLHACMNGGLDGVVETLVDAPVWGLACVVELAGRPLSSHPPNPSLHRMPTSQLAA